MGDEDDVDTHNRLDSGGSKSVQDEEEDLIAKYSVPNNPIKGAQKSFKSVGSEQVKIQTKTTAKRERQSVDDAFISDNACMSDSNPVEDGDEEDDEDIDEDEDANHDDEEGSPERSKFFSDRDDLDAYLTNEQASDNSHNGSQNSINMEQLHAFQESALQMACQNTDLAMAALSSAVFEVTDRANHTIISRVKGHIREQKQTAKPAKNSAIDVSNHTIDAQRILRIGRKSRFNQRLNQAITCGEYRPKQVWHAAKKKSSRPTAFTDKVNSEDI